MEMVIGVRGTIWCQGLWIGKCYIMDMVPMFGFDFKAISNI